MELLVLCWRLLLLTLVTIAFTVSLASPIVIASSSLMLSPLVTSLLAMVIPLTGWREAPVILACLNKPGVILLDVAPGQNLLASLLTVVLGARPRARSAFPKGVLGWLVIIPMEWTRLVTKVTVAEP